jgi:dTDP-4-amino-4,6-dideoxygalactose transaminase
MRSEFLPFALPDLDENEIREVSAVLASGWLTTGSKTKAFEAGVAGYVGCKHTVAVNSCTAAMHLALEALGVGPGDEVITTPYTFASTAAVVQHLGARPVFVDIERDTLTIDPARVASAVTPKTRVLLPVHIAGHAADLAALYSVAADLRLAMVEDAAHAFPTRCSGSLIGSAALHERYGQGVRSATCFSFYATKTLTTGEGGMICTEDDAVAERARLMSLHGLSRDAWARYTKEGSWFYDVLAPGFKYNLTDLASAIGLCQLAKTERMLEKRRAISCAYNDAFSALPQVQIPTLRPGVEHSWHLYTLRLHPERLSIDRDAFIAQLQAARIGTSVHFIPLHLHSHYRRTYGLAPQDFPVALEEFLREISLPIYSAMTDQDVADVIAAVGEIAERHAV